MSRAPLMAAMPDQTAVQDVDFLEIIYGELRRLGQRNLYWLKRGTYESVVAPWVTSESERAAILARARREDPAHFDGKYKGVYESQDLQLEKLKKRVSTYEASNPFMRFLRWLFTGIGRDIELLCFYHCRHLYLQFFPGDIAYGPLKTWGSPIDEFLNDRVDDRLAQNSVPSTRSAPLLASNLSAEEYPLSTHPARDIRYLSRLSGLRPTAQKLLNFLPELRARLPKTLGPSRIIPRKGVPMTQLIMERDDRDAAEASARRSNPARLEGAGALVLQSGRGRIHELTEAARAYGPVENWREILGVGESADPETVQRAFQTVSTVLTRFNSADLIRLYAAYQQAITSFGLSEAQIQRMIEIRNLEEELRQEHALNAQIDSMLVEARETQRGAQALNTKLDELVIINDRHTVAMKLLQSRIATLDRVTKIMLTLKEGGVSVEEAALLSRELQDLLSKEPYSSSAAPTAPDLKVTGASARRSSTSSSSTITIFRAEVSSVVDARGPAEAVAIGSEEDLIAAVASTPCA